MVRKFITLFVLFLMLCVLGCSTVNNPKAEADAIESANMWLSLIDNEKYEESWHESAQSFRNAILTIRWYRTMETARKPLGAVLSREVISKSYQTSLPGAPDGQYVIIQFKTSFSNKNSVIEIVTPMLDNDGKWRVSGYYIK